MSNSKYLGMTINKLKNHKLFTWSKNEFQFIKKNQLIANFKGKTIQLDMRY